MFELATGEIDGGGQHVAMTDVQIDQHLPQPVGGVLSLPPPSVAMSGREATIRSAVSRHNASWAAHWPGSVWRLAAIEIADRDTPGPAHSVVDKLRHTNLSKIWPR